MLKCMKGSGEQWCNVTVVACQSLTWYQLQQRACDSLKLQSGGVVHVGDGRGPKLGLKRPWWHQAEKWAKRRAKRTSWTIGHGKGCFPNWVNLPKTRAEMSIVVPSREVAKAKGKANKLNNRSWLPWGLNLQQTLYAKPFNIHNWCVVKKFQAVNNVSKYTAAIIVFKIVSHKDSYVVEIIRGCKR